MGADYRRAHRSNLCGASPQQAQNTTIYQPLSGLAVGHLLEGRAEQWISINCTLRNLRVHSHNPPGVGETFIFTVRVNGAPTALQATITGAVNEGADLVNAIQVGPGDYVTVEIVSSAAAANNTFHTWTLEQIT